MPPGIEPGSVFPFHTSGDTCERAESVYWRKYAITIESVHERGCVRAQLKNEKLLRESKEQNVEYRGARTASVGAVRGIRTGRGFGIAVEHHPEASDRSHTHLCIIGPSGEREIKKLKANDRVELVHFLCEQCFGALEEHSCGS